jgi:hypothetical protein
MWGPLKPPVHQKQLSAASHEAASTPGELIHIDTVHFLKWTMSQLFIGPRPTRYFFNCVLLEKLMFNIIQ